MEVLLHDKKLRDAKANVHNLHSRVSSYVFRDLKSHISVQPSERLRVLLEGGSSTRSGKVLHAPRDLGDLEWLHRCNPEVQNEMDGLITSFCAMHQPPLDADFFYQARSMGLHNSLRNQAEHLPLEESYQQLNTFMEEQAAMQLPTNLTSLLPAGEGDITAVVHVLGAYAKQKKDKIAEDEAKKKEAKKNRGS